MTIRFLPTPLASPPSGDLAATSKRQRGRKLDSTIGSALTAEGQGLAALDRLMKGEALAVTTGQQAGLFTGPLFAIEKALSAAALAEALSAAGTPHVAVFWVAGDDHDFAEINHCWVIAQDGKPAKVVLRERASDAPMLPAYREPVGADGPRALDELEALLPASDFRTETMAWLRKAYGSGENLAEAYARAMAELLAPYGVVVARGWSGSLKSAAKHVLIGAARHAAAIDTALAAVAADLAKGGAQVPVGVGDGLSLVMLETPQGRDRLRTAGDGKFETRRGGQSVSLAELEAIAATSPERLSGNVLLRPAVEAALFPTVGYLGGPGELAYLAQTGPVFETLDVPRPARLPRLSGMLIEAKVDKVIERYKLAPEDFAQPEGALTSRIAKASLPEDASGALGDLRAAIEKGYGKLAVAATAVDRTLEKTVESARNQALGGTQEIEKKIVAALKRTNDTAIQQVARARDQLYPNGVPQEREISAVSFLSRHGRSVLDLLHDAARTHARRLLEGHSGAA